VWRVSQPEYVLGGADPSDYFLTCSGNVRFSAFRTESVHKAVLNARGHRRRRVVSFSHPIYVTGSSVTSSNYN